jgi:alkylhydroperoxidase/carboxymuconolactone decarboxylase family protein YurZ
METYYDPKDLKKFEEIGRDAPELANKFFDYYGAVFAEGALTEREKGADVEEMTEALHVVTAIRGGASLVHGVQMRKLAEKLSI